MTDLEKLFAEYEATSGNVSRLEEALAQATAQRDRLRGQIMAMIRNEEITQSTAVAPHKGGVPVSPRGRRRRLPKYIRSVTKAFRGPDDVVDTQELAERLGLSIPTARNRLYRAYKFGAVRRVRRGEFALVQQGGEGT